MPTLQAPIGSGFNAATTAADVISGIKLDGKTAIVTGGYSGLGRETVRALRVAGARVIVPARDVGRSAKALTGIDVEIEPMDLLDPASIDAFAERFRGRGCKKHIPMEQQIAAGVLSEQGEPICDPAKNIKTVEQGAATGIWCATSRLLDGLGGAYCENCDVAALTEDGAPLNLDDSSKQFGVMTYAIDPGSADRLWSLSEQLIGRPGSHSNDVRQ